MHRSSPEKAPMSFLSMDVEGRVIRFDSFSKMISSGMRIGWVTGPKFLIERIQFDQQGSALHPSGISQTILLAILNTWGYEGWERQLISVQRTYKERRDWLIHYAEKYLKGLAEWFIPSAGMFVWFKLLGISDTRELIKTKAVQEKFLMVPGSSFHPEEKPSSYIRASYSTATLEQMEEAILRLSVLLKKEMVSPNLKV